MCIHSYICVDMCICIYICHEYVHHHMSEEWHLFIKHTETGSVNVRSSIILDMISHFGLAYMAYSYQQLLDFYGSNVKKYERTQPITELHHFYMPTTCACQGWVVSGLFPSAKIVLAMDVLGHGRSAATASTLKLEDALFGMVVIKIGGWTSHVFWPCVCRRHSMMECFCAQRLHVAAFGAFGFRSHVHASWY